MKLVYCPECREPLRKLSDNTTYVCSAGHEIYNNNVVGADIFVVENDRVLMGLRGIDPGKGKIDSIGGFLNFGETLEEGARREFTEETGQTVELMGFITSHLHRYNEHTHVVGISFAGRITGGTPQANDDVEELMWLKFDEIQPEDLSFEWLWPTLKEVERWFKNHNQ